MEDTQVLPKETLKEILFNLPVKDVINYCRTNEDAQNLCQDNTFWREYMEKNYDIGKKNELEVEIEDDFGIIGAHFTYKFGKAKMNMSICFDKGDDKYNKLYSAIYYGTEYNYDAGDRNSIGVNNKEVEFESESGFRITIPIEDAKQAFRKVYEMNISD